MIILDSGHGGEDPGAIAGEYSEKNIVLRVQKAIESMFESTEYYSVIREMDETIGLKTRVNRINEIKPDGVVSIHANSAGTSEANGYTLFHYPGSDQGRRMAICIDNFMAQSEFISSRGVRSTDDRRDSDLHSYFAIVGDTVIPAVLCEIGFLSHKNDRQFITSIHGIIQTARHIYNGLKLWAGGTFESKS